MSVLFPAARRVMIDDAEGTVAEYDGLQTLAALPVDVPQEVGDERKLTDSLIERMCAVLVKKHSLRAACAIAGISKETHERWLALARRAMELGETPSTNGYVYYYQCIFEAEGCAEAALVDMVAKRAPDDWKAAAFLLERRFPEWASKASLTQRQLDEQHALAMKRAEEENRLLQERVRQAKADKDVQLADEMVTFLSRINKEEAHVPDAPADEQVQPEESEGSCSR